MPATIPANRPPCRLLLAGLVGVLVLGSLAAAAGPVVAAPVGDRVVPRLAALDLVDPDTVLSTSAALVLGDAVRGAIRAVLPAPRYVIMTRENIFELLPADVSLADCVGTCAVETARRIGADYVVTGRVGRLGDLFRVTLELHATDTANLLTMESARAASASLLEDPIRAAATDLALILPGAARDHRRLAREAAVRQQRAARSHGRMNTVILGGAAASLAAGGYFHLAASSDHDAHLEATDAATAAATWDDYQAGITLRNVTLGVGGALLAWRLVRALGGGADGPTSPTAAHTTGPASDVAGPAAVAIHLAGQQVFWSRAVGFSW